jgi:hypothetical protein
MVAVVGTVGGSAVAVATAFWLVVQAVEKIANFRVNRRKLKAELRKLESEERQKNEIPASLKNTKELLERREAIQAYDNVIERLRDSDIRIIDTSIRIVRRDAGRDDSRVR